MILLDFLRLALLGNGHSKRLPGECGTPVCMPATWKMLKKRFWGKVIYCISAKKQTYYKIHARWVLSKLTLPHIMMTDRVTWSTKGYEGSPLLYCRRTSFRPILSSAFPSWDTNEAFAWWRYLTTTANNAERQFEGLTFRSFAFNFSLFNWVRKRSKFSLTNVKNESSISVPGFCTRR